MGDSPAKKRLPRSLATGVAAAVLALLPSSAIPEDPTPALDEVLARLSRIADLYRDQALRFTCDETIFYSGHTEPVLHKFKYIYHYRDGTLLDYRAPRGRGEKRSDRKNARIALENYGLPTYLLRAYSWIFLFDDSNRHRYRFVEDGSETVFGRPALRIRFEALPPFDADDDVWFGTAWVDRFSSQLLKVEAIHAKDLEEKTAMGEALLAGGAEEEWPYRPSYTYLTHLTEFDEEENGLRFPSRVVIRSTEHEVIRKHRRWTTVENPIFHVSQTYKRYRFFGVRTAEEIQRIVAGDR